MEVELVKRISASGLKVLTGTPKPKEGEKPVLVARIAANVKKCSVKPNANGGESTQMVGEFLAITGEGKDSKAYKSNTLYLPEYFSSQVAEAMEQTKSGVKFGCSLHLVYSKSAIGYEWQVTPKEKLQVSNTDLEKLLPAGNK